MTTQTTTRRSFTDEFKREAVSLLSGQSPVRRCSVSDSQEPQHKNGQPPGQNTKFLTVPV
jgi:hypothetical protein